MFLLLYSICYEDVPFIIFRMLWNCFFGKGWMKRWFWRKTGEEVSASGWGNRRRSLFLGRGQTKIKSPLGNQNEVVYWGPVWILFLGRDRRRWSSFPGNDMKSSLRDQNEVLFREPIWILFPGRGRRRWSRFLWTKMKSSIRDQNEILSRGPIWIFFFLWKGQTKMKIIWSDEN